jgi:CBS domain-containing protein
MKVADLMQTDVRTVDPEVFLEEAMLTLADSHVTALPVVDQSGKLLGVLSRTDILAAEEETESPAERNRLLARTRVQDLMTPFPVTISPESEVKAAAQEMLNAGVHRLYVTKNERVVGVISMSDIVRAVAAGAL